jgi:hypothetical protein
VPENSKAGAAVNLEMFCFDTTQSSQYLYPSDRYGGLDPNFGPAALQINGAQATLAIAGKRLAMRQPYVTERCNARRRIAGLPPEAIEDACRALPGCTDDCNRLKATVTAALREKPDILRASIYRDKCP